MHQPPEWLHQTAAACWQRLAPTLAAHGRLEPLFESPFALLCQLEADVRELREQLGAEGWVLAAPTGRRYRHPAAAAYFVAVRLLLRMYGDFALMPPAALALEVAEARAAARARRGDLKLVR